MHVQGIPHVLSHEQHTPLHPLSVDKSQSNTSTREISVYLSYNVYSVDYCFIFGGKKQTPIYWEFNNNLILLLHKLKAESFHFRHLTSND